MLHFEVESSPFVIGLGLAIGNLWAKLGMLAGIGTAIACMLIGTFPMDQWERHIKVALFYF